jgi:hypothetical protein
VVNLSQVGAGGQAEATREEICGHAATDSFTAAEDRPHAHGFSGTRWARTGFDVLRFQGETEGILVGAELRGIDSDDVEPTGMPAPEGFGHKEDTGRLSKTPPVYLELRCLSSQ